jgi:hypothetical protein
VAIERLSTVSRDADAPRPPRIPPIHCLQAFVALARLHRMTQAAEDLLVTPSAVSHRMRQLETPLGSKLFARRDFRLGAGGPAAAGGDAHLLAPDPAAPAGRLPPRRPVSAWP